MKPEILAVCAILATACAENPPPNVPPGQSEPTASTSTVEERTSTRVDMQPADSSPHRDESARAAGNEQRGASNEQSAARGPEIATTPPSSYSVSPPSTNGETRMPVAQGNSTTDLRLTQDIRTALMNEGALSTTAKNVKIITSNSKVTLRGSVKNEAEHTLIVSDARRIAGADNVDDQLEVVSK